MWTFPYPPAESGLFDLGPLTGVWWVLVIIQMFRMEHFEKKQSAFTLQPKGEA
jgi:hypothetical protein